MKIICKKTVTKKHDSNRKRKVLTEGKRYEIGLLIFSKLLVVGIINNFKMFHRILTIRVHSADFVFFHEHFDTDMLDMKIIYAKKSVLMENSEHVGKEAFTEGRKYEISLWMSRSLDSVEVSAIDNFKLFHRILTTKVSPADFAFLQEHFNVSIIH